jgi:hypothetical protein
MTFQDYNGNTVNVGDFILYVTKTESPHIQFGYVEEIKPGTRYANPNTDTKVKIRHATIDGRKKNKEVWYYDETTQKGGYRETDSPSRAWLTLYNAGAPDKRILLTQPI